MGEFAKKLHRRMASKADSLTVKAMSREEKESLIGMTETFADLDNPCPKP